MTLLGAVKTGEAQTTPTLLCRRWMVAARILSESDSGASGIAPFSPSHTLPLLPFASQEAGEKAQDE